MGLEQDVKRNQPDTTKAEEVEQSPPEDTVSPADPEPATPSEEPAVTEPVVTPATPADEPVSLLTVEKYPFNGFNDQYIRRAFDESGMSPDVWNGLSDDERVARIEAVLTKATPNAA